METKFNEIKRSTSDSNEMINRYTSGRVLRIYTEDFIDEDTGEAVSIERKEVIADRGKLIDQDLLTRLQFYLQSGDISAVEVSNQKRTAFYSEYEFLYPYTATIQICNKKHKFLLYAAGLEQAIRVLCDYVELNYIGSFNIITIKEFTSCIILSDTLKPTPDNPLSFLNEISADDNGSAELSVEETDSEVQKKFYQMGVCIEYTHIKNSEPFDIHKTFVIHTHDTNKALAVISHCLTTREKEAEKEAEITGKEYIKQQFSLKIETAKVIPISCFIPLEFSQAYFKQNS